ncbi:MAG: hypothetical protein PW844_20685 [Pantoea sp.]|uniref:hypothetical protein n=1 Tax=Pantoea sp. TaxID=69393 RepID=UPI002393A4EF|nr:hypothetical protein [Pantoea sp.]MDE1188849.1 hypothetical protein [Pantoea sp.]
MVTDDIPVAVSQYQTDIPVFRDLEGLCGQDNDILPFDAGSQGSISAAATALTAFAHCTGLANDNEPADTIITDLLADLMHLCDQTGLPFEGILCTARMHHEDEKMNEYGSGAS